MSINDERVNLVHLYNGLFNNKRKRTTDTF